MAFEKCTYCDGQTVITAKNMNDIQDAICGLEQHANETSQIFAGALKGTASGAAVTLPDVSPVEHEVAVAVTSKNLINPADVAYGYELANSKGNLLENPDWYVTGWVPVKPSTTYYISGTSSPFRAEVDENFKALTGDNNLAPSRVFTTTENTYYCMFNSITEGYDKPQLEEGSIETPFTPYLEDVGGVHVLVDGTEYAQGEPIPSVSPSMSITTDTAGAVVSIEYIQDINVALEKLTQAIISLGGNV